MPKMLTHLALALAIASAVLGCRTGSTKSDAASTPTTRGGADEWLRYDDPRLSTGQRQAVRAATQAMLDPNRPPPDFDQTFRYELSQNRAGWLVNVWHVQGFKNGKPQFAPGGLTGVQLDRTFKLMHLIPGE